VGGKDGKSVVVVLRTPPVFLITLYFSAELEMANKRDLVSSRSNTIQPQWNYFRVTV
jgi:hypothetical protein